jgi:GcrA cell cycle regulator
MISWTDDRVDRLKTLWSEGLSASQIAADLGGVTRNAVIGKVHRLGLSGRAKPQPQAARPRKSRQPTHPMRPAAVTMVVGNTVLKVAPEIELAPRVEIEPEAPGAQRVSILTLTEQMCKWPIGDPSRTDFHFCGRRSDSGVPYCSHHSRLAYQPARERKRA